MFESAIIRNHGDNQNPVNAGLVAETLLFYDNVHVISDVGLLIGLLKNIGSDNLFWLLDSKLMSISWQRSIPATHTQTTHGLPIHNFVAITLHGRGKTLGNFDALHQAIERNLGKTKNSSQIANKLYERMKILNTLPGVQDETKFLNAIQEEFSNEKMLFRAAIIQVLEVLVKSYSIPKDFDFLLTNQSNQIVFLSNLDFDMINKEYQKSVSTEHSTITAAFLISHALDAWVDMHIASQYMAEIITSESSSRIIQLKMASLLQKRNINLNRLQLFQETLLHDARAIREAISSGERTFGNFIPVLEKSKKFKKFLKGQNPDANLLQEYYAACAADTFVEKLPYKSAKFVTFTGLGLLTDLITGSPGLSTAASISIGATEPFLVDKLIKGWRPNQFIEGPLRKFVKKDL
jgi:hypothetical protein